MSDRSKDAMIYCNLVIPRCRLSTYTAAVPLVSLVQSAGTLYRTIWSHV